MDIEISQNLTKSFTPSELPECNENDDLVGNFMDCKKYKRCINGQIFYYDCPQEYVFDIITKKCTIESDARCLNCKSSSFIIIVFLII